MNFHQNAVEIKKLYSYVADKPLFSDTLQVNEVLYKISKIDERFDVDKCFEFLNKQKIVLHSKIYELSQGEKKILLFAIGYFTKSSILVLDNLFSGIGLIAKKEILDLLRDYMDENKMIILVTEDPLVIKSLADYVIVLENGRINTKEDIVELQERFNTTDIEKINILLHEKHHLLNDDSHNSLAHIDTFSQRIENRAEKGRILDFMSLVNSEYPIDEHFNYLDYIKNTGIPSTYEVYVQEIATKFFKENKKNNII